MAKPPRTPKQLAEEKGTKKTYSFSLQRSNVEYLAEEATVAGVSLSDLVDEALRFYIERIKEEKDRDR